MTAEITRLNPARISEEVGRVAADTVSGVRARVDVAAAAFEQWSVTPFEERAERLAAGVAAVGERSEELARLLTRELGKVIADTRGEIAFASAFTAYASDVARRVLPATEIDDGQGRLRVVQRPYGVVAAITPWNAPVILSLLKVAPALLCGNTVVVKPSPQVPLAINEVLTVMAAHLPAGVLSLVNGEAAVGQALLSHPAVAKIAFTGGGATGRAVMRAAAERVTPLVLELGGNDPAIFLDNADLSEDVVRRAVFGTFLTSGQVCMAAKRLYVPRRHVDEFVDVYRAVADKALILGDPLREDVTVGPVVSEDAVLACADLIADARRRGGRVLELGQVPDTDVLGGGWFVHPSLVLGLDDDAPLVATEQFGPIVPLLTYDSVDEVVGRANRGELGLASSVWSADEEHAFAVSQRLDAGFTFVNTHNRSGMSLRAPFGGTKGSGFGREFGEAGIREYVRTHAINLPVGARPGATMTGSAYPGT